MSVPLDEKRKKWYDIRMKNENELHRVIANNLTHYRKAAGLTQAELAEKINYSDKSISKWESGNGIPDVYTLMQLAALYQVTLNDLVGEGEVTLPTPLEQKKRMNKRRFLIALLSSGIVWLAATCLFVVMQIPFPTGQWWLIFLYALLANSILFIVYSTKWKYRIAQFLSVSILIWTAITCVYLTVSVFLQWSGAFYEMLWCLYLIGIPLQGLETLWVFFRSLLWKDKKGESKKKNRVNAINGEKE